MTDYFAPATIRFALPPPELPGVYPFNYEQLAAEFMAANPNIVVKIVPLTTLPQDLTELAEYDAVAMQPTADLVASGLVYDLTNFALSDPTFFASDYYQTIWQGAHWQGRLWFVPQSAQMKLLFYDKSAFQLAELPEPTWQWNWAEMETGYGSYDCRTTTQFSNGMGAYWMLGETRCLPMPTMRAIAASTKTAHLNCSHSISMRH